MNRLQFAIAGREMNPWLEMDRLHRDVTRWLDRFRNPAENSWPLLNVWWNDDEVVVAAELPGIDPAGVDLTVDDRTLSLRGQRAAKELKDGEKLHRRERSAGEFHRTVTLPYAVDSSKAEARYDLGVLRIRLPRHESTKPKKIQLS